MEKEKDNKKKPLKLSSSGRMQIRKNLGPSGDKAKSTGNKKTIQIVFRNKNNQQKSSSTSQSNFRGSSSFRSSPNHNNRPTTSQINPNFSNVNKNKNFENKNKKTADTKKQQPKKSTLKPIDDEFNKLDAKKILEQEDQEFDRFPSLAKIKRAREKEKLQSQEQTKEIKISREVSVPDYITVQDLANELGMILKLQPHIQDLTKAQDFSQDFTLTDQSGVKVRRLDPNKVVLRLIRKWSHVLGPMSLVPCSQSARPYF